MFDPATRAIARRSLSLNFEELRNECDESFFIASGPGGQHRNKTESGVRLQHRPTGVVVTATERRSQVQNRSVAVERLREQLRAMSFEPKVRRPTKPTRSSKERRLSDKRHRSKARSQRGGEFD
jgi:protein subunit release factor B